MRIKQIIPLLLLVVAIAIGNFGSLCGVQESCFLWSTLYDYVFSVFDPIYIFSIAAIPAALLLPLVSKKIYRTWLRFAVIWIALSMVMVMGAPETMNAWFYVIDYSKSPTAQFMGTAFSILSILILLAATLKERFSKKRA